MSLTLVTNEKICHQYQQHQRYRKQNLPPVTLIPVVHLHLRISPRIFGKIQNDPNIILGGLGEDDSWKNPNAKISWQCPFKFCRGHISCPSFEGANKCFKLLWHLYSYIISAQFSVRCCNHSNSFHSTKMSKYTRLLKIQQFLTAPFSYQNM